MNDHAALTSPQHATGTIDRRAILAAIPASALTLIAAASQPQQAQGWGIPAPNPSLTGPSMTLFDTAKGEFVLPPLPYPAASLEPALDSKTIETHHSKHHAAHVAALNRAAAELRKLRDSQGDPSLLPHWSRQFAFHLAAHADHTLGWNLLAPTKSGGGAPPEGKLLEAVTKAFGSVGNLLAQVKAAAATIDAAGWIWLGHDRHTGRLSLLALESAQPQPPATFNRIMGFDLWEHAYYLQYQHDRAAYIDGVWKVANWKFAALLFDQVIKG